MQRFTFALALLVMFLTQPAMADTWMPPTEFSTFSPNHRLQAKVIPSPLGSGADADRHAHVDLYDLPNPKEPKLAGTIQLANPVAPLTVHVSDDGQFLVALDNWGGGGRGPHVLGFYSGSKLIKEYSLEDIITQGLPEPHMVTVSSTPWRNFAFEFLDPAAPTLAFAIYFIREKLWLAWDLRTGMPLKPDRKSAARWEKRLRQHAIDRLAETKNDVCYDGLHILNNLHQPQDRVALTAQLANAQMNWSGSHGDEPLAFRAGSNNRQMADEFLAKWDRDPTDDKPWKSALGTLETVIQLPAPPQLENEDAFISIIPADVPEDRWLASGPYQHAPLWLYLKNGPKATDSFTFRMETLTPGRYWLKVVYHRGEMAGPAFHALYPPKEGDFQSVGRTLFEIRANETTKLSPVPCIQPVGAATPTSSSSTSAGKTSGTPPTSTAPRSSRSTSSPPAPPNWPPGRIAPSLSTVTMASAPSVPPPSSANSDSPMSTPWPAASTPGRS